MEYDIEAILEIYEDDYNPRPMAQEPRNMKLAQVPRSEMDNFNTPDLDQGADSILKPGETLEDDFDVEFRRPNAEGGRSGFMEGKLVKQGPNTGKWVVRDLYSRGDKRGSTLYFNSETEASKAIADRKTETGKQQTNAELTKKYKSLLKEEGYKSWADAPKDIKKLLKNRMSSPIKVGPSKIKEKTIKLLEEKKPINSKTGLPYTQEEYIKLTTGQKSSLSARLRDKKQKGQYQKRQGYYPEKEGNRLINYMKKAAEQQGKLPIKDRTYTNVFVDDKFVGVNDIKNNKLYTHIDYDLSKDGAKKGTVITKHPGYEELDVFFKAAKKFKYESPDKLLGSYFSKYERVPTYNEMYNFFTVDRNAPVKAFTSNNGLTIHHQDVIAKNPTSNFQLLTTKKNTEANTIMNKLKRGEISEDRANYDLKKIGATQEGYGIAKEKISAGKGLGVAKREAVKLFKDAYKVNPDIVEDITQKLGILGCPKGLQAASGGRIKFSKGTTCAIKGREILEKGLKNGFKESDVGLAKKILGSGKFLKDAVSLRGLFGPAALAFTVAAEAGLVGYDMLSTGKSFKEAVGSSVFNYMLGDKTKIDEVEERDKRMVAEGMTPEQMGKIKYFESMMGDLQQGFSNYDNIKDLEKKIEDNTLNQQVDPQLFPDQAFQLNTQLDKAQADNQDYFRTNKVGELENYFTPKEDGTIPFAQGASTLAEGLRRNELAQLQSVDNPLQSRKGDEKRSARIRELMLQNPDVKNYMGSYPSHYGFMEGGIASLNVKK